jgi:hypothetical protein
MKQYNPNTKYGRKKAKEQAAQNYDNMTPEQKAQHDSDGCLVMAIIIGIVAIIIFAAGGDSNDLLKWLSR